ncbi:hypothetical protein BDZ89DRAFT_1146589 [Hymenopellis radicata]|nr:hypothetical protein BDZ89DRAFT_1146589 [Hymenopellis radicata]
MSIPSVQDTSSAGDAKASPAEVTSPGIGSLRHDISAPYPAAPAPPAWFPAQCVYDPLIAQDAYVEDDYPLRSGVLYQSVPRGPLKPAYLPAAPDGSKTFFYCITVGIKVGIVTDASLAAEYTTVSPEASRRRGTVIPPPFNTSMRTLLPARSQLANGASLAATDLSVPAAF